MGDGQCHIGNKAPPGTRNCIPGSGERGLLKIAHRGMKLIARNDGKLFICNQMVNYLRSGSSWAAIETHEMLDFVNIA